MTCITLTLTAALATVAQLPVGTCALECPADDAIIAAGDQGRGWGMVHSGEWFPVIHIDGKWVMLSEQEPEQCARALKQ